MAKEFKITSLRLADLEKELNYLKTTREREIAAMIAEARSYGDLSENSEYDAAKNEQAKLYGRIAEIEDVLSHAVIIEDENEATGRVGLGCTVVVEDLKTTREREIAAMIAEARSYGDLSENSEYDAAKNEQAKLYGRIAEIEDILSHAVVIEDENEASGRVGLGCTVTVEDLATGEQTDYRITGSQEANPMEFKLSDDSPFGRAVVGKGIGDTFMVNAPAGAYQMKVVDITREG